MYTVRIQTTDGGTTFAMADAANCVQVCGAGHMAEYFEVTLTDGTIIVPVNKLVLISIDAAVAAAKA